MGAGLVSEVDPAHQPPPGLARRYYTLSGAGRRALGAEARRLKRAAGRGNGSPVSWVLRLLLRAFPGRFRDRFGAEMAEQICSAPGSPNDCRPLGRLRHLNDIERF